MIGRRGSRKRMRRTDSKVVGSVERARRRKGRWRRQTREQERGGRVRPVVIVTSIQRGEGWRGEEPINGVSGGGG